MDRLAKLEIMTPAPALLLSLACCTIASAAETPSAAHDKSLRRAFNTDRPSKTDSPYTIDAGAFQIETDLANWTLDTRHPQRAAVCVRTVLIGQTNFKLGLTNRVDLQVIAQNYVNRRTTGDDFGPAKSQTGFGDTTLRLKMNLLGNDGGKLALALLPSLKMPTNTDGLGNKVWEPALVLPVAYSLPAGFTLFAQTRLDLLRDGPGPRRVLSGTSIGLSRTLVEKLSGYAEFYSPVSRGRDHPWVGTADFGLIYQITPDFSVDVNTFFGLTRSANDINVALGFARRF